MGPRPAPRTTSATTASSGVVGPRWSSRVDRVEYYVVPVVVGGGTPWLPPDLRLDLRLVGHHRFDCGVVHLAYDVADRP